MAKRLLLVLIIASVFAMGAFAQFSMEGGIRTYFDMDTTHPVIGFEYGFSKVDLLWGTMFHYKSIGGDAPSVSGYEFGLYGGAGFKLVTADKWTVSLPLIVDITVFGGDLNKYGDKGKGEGFAFAIRPGMKAKYAFNNKWSLYTGVLIDFVSFGSTKKLGVKGTETDFFNSGCFMLGLNYKF